MATFATFADAAGQRRARRAQRVGVERLGVADADEHDGLGAELARRGHGERLAPLALEAGLRHELREVPPSARSTTSAPGPRRPSVNTGTARRSARTLSAAAVLVSIVSGTARGVYGFRGKLPRRA